MELIRRVLAGLARSRAGPSRGYARAGPSWPVPLPSTYCPPFDLAPGHAGARISTLQDAFAMRTTVLPALGLFLAAGFAQAFDSGSTGADGELAPTVNTEVVLPESGVLNYTSINIPAGVRVSFRANTANTPVTLRVSGDALIAGILDVSGQSAPDSNGAGDGNVADDGLPGRGGPGGYSGGRGGQGDPSTAAGSRRMAAAGVGPGGGRPAVQRFDNLCSGGSGGSFASAGSLVGNSSLCGLTAAPIYGSADLLPLVGGSGGAGGHGSAGIGGAGGGGGGGALLLAVSGTLNVTGQILANGGNGGRVGGTGSTELGAVGGGGSGGAIRIVATTLSGNGTISAIGGRVGAYNNGNPSQQNLSGGEGRIRLEAEVLQRTAATTPAFTTGLPGPLALEGVPSLRIARVGGIDAPAAPTGHADVVLSIDAPNPVELVINTVNVPLGNTITVIVNPPGGTPQSVISGPIGGSAANGVATASVDIPPGSSVLLATLSFSVGAAQGGQLAALTGGEPVVQVELAARLGDGAQALTLVTASGRRVEVGSVL